MNHVEASNQELLDEALRLSEQRAQTYMTPARKDQLTREINYALFEYATRNGSVIITEEGRLEHADTQSSAEPGTPGMQVS